MKSLICLILAISSLVQTLASTAAADEGIWPFNNVPKAEIKRRYGFDITEPWLRKIRLASVRFNSGASGSFVSSDGLVMTNHHVASETLQKLSTPGKDYYQNGFYARTRAEEIKALDLELNVLLSTEDVTVRVNDAVKANMTPAEASDARQAEIASIEKASLAATGLRSDVVPLYRGGQYHLYRYKVYTDVRIVFAPEFDVAFFGGDPDNFSYPKYSLDVAFFRVYEDGRPLKVENYLSFSKTGVREDELVFTSGNPGATARLNTIAHLEFLRDAALPFTIRHLNKLEEALERYGALGREQTRRAQADLFDARNNRKRTRGQLDGLENKSLMAKKRRAEDLFRAKITADREKQKEYGHIWQEITQGRKQLTHRFLEISFLESPVGINTGLFGYARTLVRLAEENTKPDTERLPEFTDARRASLELSLFSPAPVFKDFETAKLNASLSLLVQELGVQHPIVKKILNGRSPEQRAKDLVDGTRLDGANYRKELATGGKKAIEASTDPMIILARLIDPQAREIRKFYEPILSSERANYGKLARALFETEGTNLYPDATFTLRLSYGAVKGYREGTKTIPPFTTLGGMFTRAAQHGNNHPFALPTRWLERKASLDLSLPINFASTNESIGGSSGSPVINREGEIVGVIFDANAQALVGHFMYDETQNRAVSVDIRGILETLRKIYVTEELVGELTKSPDAAAGLGVLITGWRPPRH